MREEWRESVYANVFAYFYVENMIQLLYESLKYFVYCFLIDNYFTTFVDPCSRFLETINMMRFQTQVQKETSVTCNICDSKYLKFVEILFTRALLYPNVSSLYALFS